ncbi:MAG: SDR family oxidoreductase [Bacteroidales bacterium]|nr:SDR family oxidoreductase [Bacteroidales bacterium]
MKDKVVIITGATSGIGRALSDRFAVMGAKLVIAARSSSTLREMEQKYKQGNVDVVAVTTDVSREEDCRALISEAVGHYGRIDVLVNNAGISMRALFREVDLSVLKRLMDVNFWGAVYCTKFALPYLLESGGSVVGVSSIAGHKGLPARAGYSSSKFALQGFLEVLRIENRKTGLHVLTASPGFTASNIRNTALAADGSMQGESPRDEKKMMTADEVAVRIIRAIVKRKSRLVLSREGRLLIMLNRFFPGWADKIVYNHLAAEPGSPFS